MEEGDGIRPGIGEQQFNLVFPKEFEKTYIAGFDDYKVDFKPNEGLFTQLRKDKYVFKYNSPRRKLIKRDIVLMYILIYGEYQMPYTKNFVKSEKELDAEVEHFYFLSKYNLL